MDQLAGALSAADLHLVVMGNPFVGLVHPCKIYNILRVGSPLLYVGPRPSHISEILNELNGQPFHDQAEHGQVERVVQHIVKLKQATAQHNGRHDLPLADRFSREDAAPATRASAGIGGRELMPFSDFRSRLTYVRQI